jgi:hypothetical protein
VSILNNDGRFVLLSKPVAYPFSEIVTGTGDGPVFDLSVDLEYYSGVAYLKAEHVEEMAHTLGMITKEEADELRAKITQLEEYSNSLPPHVESLVHGIHAVIDIYRHASAGPHVAIDVPVYLSDPDPGTEQREGNVGKSDSTDSAKPVTGKSDKSAGKDSSNAVGKGPDELSGDSGDGFGF